MPGSLELDEDLASAQRDWSVQRAGRTLMALAVGAALAGALGSGPLSSARLRSPDAAWELEYRRFERHEAPAELRFTIRAGGSTDPVRLRLGREYLDTMGFERALPEPLSVETGGDAVTFVFDVDDPQKDAGILLELRPKSWGRVKTEVGLAGGATAELAQLVYP